MDQNDRSRMYELHALGTELRDQQDDLDWQLRQYDLGQRSEIKDDDARQEAEAHLADLQDQEARAFTEWRQLDNQVRQEHHDQMQAQAWEVERQRADARLGGRMSHGGGRPVGSRDSAPRRRVRTAIHNHFTRKQARLATLRKESD